MSDIMLLGVLRMPIPDNPADMGVLEWAQVKDRMREAADEIERLRAKLAARDALLKEARECIDIHNHVLAARIDAALSGTDSAQSSHK